jgi:hypothetical protein
VKGTLTVAKKKDLRFAVTLNDGETWATIKEGCGLVLVDMNVVSPPGKGCMYEANDEAFRNATVASWNLNWIVRRMLDVLIGVHSLENVEEIKGWFDGDSKE